MESVDRLERRLSTYLLWGTVGFAVWQGGFIASALLEGPSAPAGLRSWRIPLVAVSMVGWAAWFYYLMRIMSIQWKARKDPKLASALNDEWARHVQAKAWTTGFVVVLVFQGVLLLIASVAPFSAAIAAQSTIMVGVVAVGVASLVFNREPADG